MTVFLYFYMQTLLWVFRLIPATLYCNTCFGWEIESAYLWNREWFDGVCCDWGLVTFLCFIFKWCSTCEDSICICTVHHLHLNHQLYTTQIAVASGAVPDQWNFRGHWKCSDVRFKCIKIKYNEKRHNNWNIKIFCEAAPAAQRWALTDVKNVKWCVPSL